MTPIAPAYERQICARIGMLTPSSNTVLEPGTQTLAASLQDRVSVHFNRIRVLSVGLDSESNAQFADAPVLAAAELLADIQPDIIAWNGTSASWLGMQSDRRLCANIEAHTGVPATSSMMAFKALFAALGVRRLGLVTPYTPELQEAIIATLSGIGVEVVSEAHCGLSDNLEIGRVPSSEVMRLCRLVAASRPDALAIVCTNLRGALLAAELEDELELPVIDSVAATLWGCLARLGIDGAALASHGSMFTQLPTVTSMRR